MGRHSCQTPAPLHPAATPRPAAGMEVVDVESSIVNERAWQGGHPWVEQSGKQSGGLAFRIHGRNSAVAL